MIRAEVPHQDTVNKDSGEEESAAYQTVGKAKVSFTVLRAETQVSSKYVVPGVCLKQFWITQNIHFLVLLSRPGSRSVTCFI